MLRCLPPEPRRASFAVAPILVAAAAMFAAACAEPRQVGPPAAWEAVLEEFADTLAAQVEADGVGGMTAALARDGETMWVRGFGYADPEALPATAETVYRVGSISKSVTAVLMTILVDEGTIGLETPLDSLVPEIRELMDRPPAASPTLRQTASHTAGLSREPNLPGAASGPMASWTDRIIESIPTTSYRTPPGTEYFYSNIGFGILGLGLERASGRPFIAQVERRIFEPLGMTSSAFEVSEDMSPRLARGFANGRDGVDSDTPEREHSGRGYKVPNGGAYSTAADLARFAAGVMGRGGSDLLSEEMRAEALSVQTPEDPGAGYGLGFALSRVEGRLLAGHGGSVAGYAAHLLFEPATGLTVVLLRNYNRGRTNLAAAARRLLLTLPPETNEVSRSRDASGLRDRSSVLPIPS